MTSDASQKFSRCQECGLPIEQCRIGGGTWSFDEGETTLHRCEEAEGDE